jgi:hypothetical protein
VYALSGQGVENCFDRLHPSILSPCKSNLTMKCTLKLTEILRPNGSHSQIAYCWIPLCSLEPSMPWKQEKVCSRQKRITKWRGLRQLQDFSLTRPHSIVLYEMTGRTIWMERLHEKTIRSLWPILCCALENSLRKNWQVWMHLMTGICWRNHHCLVSYI